MLNSRNQIRIVGWGGNSHKGKHYVLIYRYLVEYGFLTYRQKYRHFTWLVAGLGEQSRTNLQTLTRSYSKSP